MPRTLYTCPGRPRQNFYLDDPLRILYKMKTLLLVALPLLIIGCRNANRHGTDWPAYGGNKENNRYSALQQINVNNVKDLGVAWSYDLTDTTASNDRGHRRGGGRDIQCQPIVVCGVFYGVYARLKLFSLCAAR